MKSGTRKTALAGLAGVAVAAIALSGCSGSGDQGDGDQVTLEVQSAMAEGTPRYDALSALAKAYEDENPDVKVTGAIRQMNWLNTIVAITTIGKMNASAFTIDVIFVPVNSVCLK